MTLLEITAARVLRAAAHGGPEHEIGLDRLSLAPGARLGLVGPSGSGKSTLLELAALLVWPQALGGFRLAPPGAAPLELAPLLLARAQERLTRVRAAHVSYAPQNGGLLPWLSVRGNAGLGLRLAGQAGAASGGRIETVAAALGLAHLLDKPPAALSGGERQRAALLRMAVSPRALMIADEPTAALDADTAGRVLCALAGIASAAGAAFLVASHDEAALRRHGFRLLRLPAPRAGSGGRLVSRLDGEVAA
ncbi:ATP-binding cassette domain-containing protein [Oceanicella sp. SM1341]|uniref:ATP-binding cassette domain-containing protein n=1 Tax=Oceanicella sp. SM1341 TaxID=1548889 RepID=UPI000E531AF6|nr:ATP-binding cassette domain-containing protein [Oceanicella sp. SM1341]